MTPSTDTPLHNAALCGHLNAVRLLVEEGRSDATHVNLRGQEGINMQRTSPHAGREPTILYKVPWGRSWRKASDGAWQRAGPFDGQTHTLGIPRTPEALDPSGLLVYSLGDEMYKWCRTEAIHEPFRSKWFVSRQLFSALVLECNGQLQPGGAYETFFSTWTRAEGQFLQRPRGAPTRSLRGQGGRGGSAAHSRSAARATQGTGPQRHLTSSHPPAPAGTCHKSCPAA